MMTSSHTNVDHIFTTSIPKRDKRLRRLAVYVSNKEPQSSTLPTTSMFASSEVSRSPNLRSLLFFSVNKIGEEECKTIVETICKDFPLLRVLYFGELQIQGTLSKHIGNLIHLRYLCFFKTLVTKIPSCIHKLQWLQTLDLRVNREVVFCLPNVLWKMKQLRHIYLPFYGGLGIAEKQRIADAPQRYVIKGGGTLRLDGLRNLQTLVFVDLDRVNLQGLSKLESMNTLCAICDTNKEALYPFLQCPTMRSLMLRVHARIINEDPLILSGCEAIHQVDLHAEPYANFSLLKPLCLEMLPSSLLCVNIWYLQLADDPLPVLEKLPNLAYLGLHMCYGGSRMVCSADGFPELQELCFDELLEFRDWEVAEGALRKLKTLVMYSCLVTDIPGALPSSVIKRIVRASSTIGYNSLRK